VENVAAHIIGAAPTWYATESYGRLKFTVEALGGWRMMPASAITYNAIKTNWAAHRDYISTALKLVPAAGTDFDKYNIAYVVAAKTPAGVLDNSPTLSAGIEVPTNRGTVHHAVTFGSDSYDRSYNVLLHETGHLMGLPDLYTFSTPYPDLMRPAGAWDIMCHLDLGCHFLGWHKYKLGWLDESQLLYVKSREISALLHPFDSSYGIKVMTVAGQSASQLYVIEIAQPLGAGGEWKDKGILIYTVDAAVPTGHDPVRVVSGPDHAPTPAETEAYGILSNAFLAPGRSQSFDLGDGTKIEVANEAQHGARFAVRVKRA
jgi:M6 family metalloprotease-like protein